MKKVKELMKRTYWSSIPAKDGAFSDEIKNVLPDYQALLARETKKSNKKLTKTAVMKGTAPVKTSLPAFLEHIKKLSEGKGRNTVLSKSRILELKRAKLSGDSFLRELIRHDKSAVLEKREQAKSEKNALMDAVIDSNGTDISSARCWQVEKIDIKRISITYRHPSHHDRDPDFDDADLPDDDGDVPSVEIYEDEEEE